MKNYICTNHKPKITDEKNGEIYDRLTIAILPDMIPTNVRIPVNSFPMSAQDIKAQNNSKNFIWVKFEDFEIDRAWHGNDNPGYIFRASKAVLVNDAGAAALASVK